MPQKSAPHNIALQDVFTNLEHDSWIKIEATAGVVAHGKGELLYSGIA